MSFRDNAAYDLLLEKARGADARPTSPRRAAATSSLTHLWERPELYRGVPVHLLGTAMRVIRYESKLSKTGWLYEAWIVTPDARKYPYVCVFEEPPEGFPIGTDVSERVVFNGYFLKIMKYQAGDVARGAPVLVGKLGWEPRARRRRPPPSRTARSSGRWSCSARCSSSRWPGGSSSSSTSSPGPGRAGEPRIRPSDDIPPEDLNAWVESVARDDMTGGCRAGARRMSRT